MSPFQKRHAYIVGIDEAGRGPLAGPVAVGAVAVRTRDYDMLVPMLLKDSKGLVQKDRELLYRALQAEERAGWLRIEVAFSSAKKIDKIGINRAVASSISRLLVKLHISPLSLILLDGLLKAPARFKYQKTIIRGDARIPIIALASIAAKVRRDRLMIRLAKKYPKYGFEKHKGYGTRAHYRALKKHGLSKVHRRTYLKNP